MTYVIEAIPAVGGYVDAIQRMDRVCFPGSGPVSFDGAFWWFALDEDKVPVGYASLSYFPTGNAFLSRSGVLPKARGNGLQRRLVRARERQARRDGYERVVTYTSVTNVHSSNTLIDCGYTLYIPPYEWGLKGAIYWERKIGDGWANVVPTS